MIQSLPRSESLDLVLATWRPQPNLYQLPEVEPFDMCECEEDWHIPIAESKKKGSCGCSGSCGGGCGGCSKKQRGAGHGGDGSRRRMGGSGAPPGVSFGGLSPEETGWGIELLEPEQWSLGDGLVSSGLKSTPPNTPSDPGVGGPPKAPTADDPNPGYSSPQEDADAFAFNEAIRLDEGERVEDVLWDVADYWGVSPQELDELWEEEDPCPELADQLFPIGEAIDDCFHPSWQDCGKPCAASATPLSFEEIQDLVADLRFRGPWETGSKDLIFGAMAFLRENIDLVQYACCLYFGPNSSVCHCTGDWIMGRNGITDFKLNDKAKVVGEYCPPASSYDPGNNINIWPSALATTDCSPWPTVEEWEAAQAAGDSTKVVEIVRLWACILAHEFAHKCTGGWLHPDHHEAPNKYDWLREVGTDWQQENCDPVSDFSVFGTFNLYTIFNERHLLPEET